MPTAYYWNQETKTLEKQGEDKFMTAFVWTNLLDVNYEAGKCFGCPQEVATGTGRLWNVKNEHYDMRVILCCDCHFKMVIDASELAAEADYRDLKDTENCVRAQ